MTGIRAVAVALGISAIVGLAAAAPAGAANCKTVQCLQKQVNKLSKTVKRDKRELQSLNSCLLEAPITLYGDPSGTPGTGYEFSNDNGSSSFLTQAISQPPAGGDVGAWVLVDGCNTTTTASVRHGAATRISAKDAPIAPIAPLLQSFPAP
jgi:hypothetical protein